MSKTEFHSEWEKTANHHKPNQYSEKNQKENRKPYIYFPNPPPPEKKEAATGKPHFNEKITTLGTSKTPRFGAQKSNIQLREPAGNRQIIYSKCGFLEGRIFDPKWSSSSFWVGVCVWVWACCFPCWASIFLFSSGLESEKKWKQNDNITASSSYK